VTETATCSFEKLQLEAATDDAFQAREKPSSVSISPSLPEAKGCQRNYATGDDDGENNANIFPIFWGAHACSWQSFILSFSVFFFSSEKSVLVSIQKCSCAITEWITERVLDTF
jgi:hypothetical protein